MCIRFDAQDIDLKEFSKIQQDISIILEEVDKQVFKRNKRSIKWNVEETTTGSLVLILAGSPIWSSIQPESVAEVIGIVRAGIDQLSQAPERPNYFNDKVLKRLESLSRIQKHKKINTLQISGLHGVTNITSQIVSNVNELIGERYESYGSVEGMLEVVNIHEDFYFEIYSVLSEKLIRAYFYSSSIDEATSLLGKRVYVYGLIKSRNDGTRLSINVKEIEPFPEESELPSIEEMVGILTEERN